MKPCARACSAVTSPSLSSARAMSSSKRERSTMPIFGTLRVLSISFHIGTILTSLAVHQESCAPAGFKAGRVVQLKRRAGRVTTKLTAEEGPMPSFG